MGMLERGARLPAVVDDHQRVADDGVAAVVLHPVTDGGHDQGDLAVVQVGPRPLVVGGEHEHLVDAAGWGLGEHGAEHGQVQGLDPPEGRVLVGHHPDEPLAVPGVGLEGGREVVLVARAERAGAAGLGLDGQEARGEVRRAGGPLGGDRDPLPGQRVPAQLVHAAP